MATQLEVANRALAEIGTRSQITALNDGSQEAEYINLLYAPFRDFLLRNGDFEFATSNPPASVFASAIAPLPPWNFAYNYPTDGVRIRQLIPLPYDPLDPVPVEFAIVTQGGPRVIATVVQISTIIYTTNMAGSENLWDPMFTEAFVRFLGSGLTFALGNGGAASTKMLNEAMEFAAVASLRDG